MGKFPKQTKHSISKEDEPAADTEEVPGDVEDDDNDDEGPGLGLLLLSLQFTSMKA
jgi:hypothetical protein